MPAGLIARIKGWAKALKTNVSVLWIAAHDQPTPIAAKCVAMAVAVYAISPVDLIPDFIPVLGYLDDVLIVPLGIILALKLIPAQLMEEFKAQASKLPNKPVSRAGLGIIIFIWLIFAYGMWRYFN